MKNMSQENNAAGISYGLGAFIIWGLMPIFFKELSHVDALEFLGSRMVWSFIFLIFLLFFRRTIPMFIQEVREVFTNKKLLLLLLFSAVLLSSNWLVYIWAIANDDVVQASLGYFINPLMTVILGMLVLGEKLSSTKLLSVGLAAVGVLYMIFEGGELPWIALYLATSFAIYGLIRKKILIGSIMGLWVEMLILLPVAGGYLIYLNLSAPAEIIGHDGYTLFMLAISGAVTTIPLVLFTSAARRLPLSTVGILQYIAPTISLLLAVFLWNEPFTMTHMIAFGCIWGALLIYSMDNFLPSRQKATNQ
ncbi:MAG: EamA family transporter RarD [Emcibacter sp.]|nr:EamA family transporter RarD [Emcibacter sp.]